MPPQVVATPGLPERRAVGGRQGGCEMIDTLPQVAQEAIRKDLEGTHQYAAHEFGGRR